MVKSRLIAVLYIMNGFIVRSERFEVHQKIGNVVNQTKRFSDWEVDELVYLDISRSDSYDLGRDDHRVASYSNIEEIISQIAKVCFMPLAFGGKLKTMADVDLRIASGADKVVISSAAVSCPDFITAIANKYGSQAVVVCVDYHEDADGAVVYSHQGREATNKKVLSWCHEVEQRGAGEVMLNCINRDGSAEGYDIATIAEVVAKLTVPVIACGGAGAIDDFVDLLSEVDVSGVAAGNIFHFTEHAYPRAKKILKEEGLNVR